MARPTKPDYRTVERYPTPTQSGSSRLNETHIVFAGEVEDIDVDHDLVAINVGALGQVTVRRSSIPAHGELKKADRIQLVCTPDG